MSVLQAETMLHQGHMTNTLYWTPGLLHLVSLNDSPIGDDTLVDLIENYDLMVCLAGPQHNKGAMQQRALAQLGTSVSDLDIVEV